MKDLRRAVLIVGVLAALPACSRSSAITSTADASGAGAPPAAQTAAAGPQTVTGTVVETMDASTYTYVRVKTDTEEVWAAASHFDVKVGDRVAVPLEVPMRNFHSQSLNRDFALIYFVSRIAREGEAAPEPSHAPMPMGSHPPSKGVEPVLDPIEPPAGGTTIARVWTDRASLAGKTVTVRGKVVKFNGGILGKNWVHLQDGSGSATEGTHDLTITTMDAAKVGEIMTASGSVAIDKDFGAGYAYPVIVENATLRPK